MKVARELNINAKGEIVARYTTNKEIEKGVTAKGTFETKVRCSLKPGKVPSAENVPYWDELTVEQQQTLTEGAIINRETGIHSGYSVEDAIDDWTAQNPGRARLGHAFDPLVGSGGSVPTPVPVGVPGLVPVP